MKSTMPSNVSKIKEEAFDLVKEEVSKLSGVKKILFETLFDKIWSIFTDDCTENDISQALNSLEKTGGEYFREDDYLNYDGAMRLLGFSRNRVGFCNLMREKGIKQNSFKNTKIGFKKSEVLALKKELDEERIAKEKNKKPKVERRKMDQSYRLSKMEKYY